LDRSNISDYNISTPFFIVRQDQTTFEMFRETTRDVYAPVLHILPLETQGYLLNYNAFEYDFFRQAYEGMVVAKRAVLSDVNNMESWLPLEEITDDYWAAGIQANPESYWPVSYMTSPV
jgi:hypothetical protein